MTTTQGNQQTLATAALTKTNDLTLTIFIVVQALKMQPNFDREGFCKELQRQLSLDHTDAVKALLKIFAS